MRILIFLSVVLGFVAFQPDTSADSSYSDLPEYAPRQMATVNLPGDYFFEHIGYQSMVLADGSILIPDRDALTLFRVSASGKFMETVLSAGRGPEEIHDITFMSASENGSALVYDQKNRKVVIIDSLGTYRTEFTVRPWSSGFLIELYGLQEGMYFMVYPSYDYLYDKEKSPETDFVIYDRQQNAYTASMTVSGKPYARKVVDDRLVGGREVPYTPEHLRARDPVTGKIYLYWSGSDRIAQVDRSLDTVRVIEIDTRKERLARAEIDTIRANNDRIQWRTLRPMLPEYKAFADKMLIDHDQNFWLKLNHAGTDQPWLVVSPEGKNKAIVKLPRKALLTHISDRHLGVRLDEVTFALYEPVGL